MKEAVKCHRGVSALHERQWTATPGVNSTHFTPVGGTCAFDSARHRGDTLTGEGAHTHTIANIAAALLLFHAHMRTRNGGGVRAFTQQRPLFYSFIYLYVFGHKKI